MRCWCCAWNAEERTICGAVDGSSPLDSGPFGLSRSSCQQLQRVRKRSMLGNVVPKLSPCAAARRPQRRGDSVSRRASDTGGAEGRRGVGPRAEPEVGARRPRLPRPCSVCVVWSGPCPCEDSAAAARVPPQPGLPCTMGSILSRRIAGVEDIDIQANSAYRYPPKSGERPAPTPGADGEERAGLGGWRGGQGPPARGPPRRRGWGALLGPPAVPPPGGPRALSLHLGGMCGALG